MIRRLDIINLLTRRLFNMYDNLWDLFSFQQRKDLYYLLIHENFF